VIPYEQDALADRASFSPTATLAMRTSLMIVPIRDKGDAVLIISWSGSRSIFGYVTRSTLQAWFDRPLTMCDCRLLVETNLHVIEPILRARSQAEEVAAELIPLIEITDSDLRRATTTLLWS
jgi:hypothetical protein